MSQGHSDTCAVKPPLLIAHDEQHDESHVVGRLEEEIRQRIAPCQRDIGHRQRHHLQIHGQRGHLRHLDHRQELRTEEQGYQDGQRQHQGCQHRRQQQQRYLHLTVHALVGRFDIVLHA